MFCYVLLGAEVHPLLLKFLHFLCPMHFPPGLGQHMCRFLAACCGTAGHLSGVTWSEVAETLASPFFIAKSRNSEANPFPLIAEAA